MKKERDTPLGILLLCLLVRGLVKLIGFLLTCLLFCWVAYHSFSALEPMEVFAVAFSVLSALIIWR